MTLAGNSVGTAEAPGRLIGGWVLEKKLIGPYRCAGEKSKVAHRGNLAAARLKGDKEKKTAATGHADGQKWSSLSEDLYRTKREKKRKIQEAKRLGNENRGETSGKERELSPLKAPNRLSKTDNPGKARKRGEKEHQGGPMIAPKVLTGGPSPKESAPRRSFRGSTLASRHKKSSRMNRGESYRKSVCCGKKGPRKISKKTSERKYRRRKPSG